MNTSDIRIKAIYKVKDELHMEEAPFAYVRGWKNGEVGFSVLDEVTPTPDFSNCGVFWVLPEDFIKPGKAPRCIQRSASPTAG